MTRYWLSHADGNSHGPYTVEELRAYAADGRVGPLTVLCDVNGGPWIPASEILPELGNAAAPPRFSTAGADLQHPVKVISTFPALALMILSLVISCFPVGIIAYIYVRKANARYAAGDAAGGQRAELVARRWMIVTWVSIALGIYLMWLTYAMCSQLLNTKLTLAGLM